MDALSGLYRSGVMPRVPPVACGGHIFELLDSWGRCRICLADVPWWALVERRYVGVGFWPGMARGWCMGSVRALEAGPGSAGGEAEQYAAALWGWSRRKC